MLSRTSIILIFEELFENSSRTQLEDHFEIFSDQIKKYGLKDLDSSASMDPKELENLDYFCTRMCRSIMRQLSTSRDIQLKGKI